MTLPLDTNMDDSSANTRRYIACNPALKDVLLVVKKIASSGVLGKSERRVQLLNYLVEMELSGRGEVIKAFSIAVDVLERDSSFDPNTDSIVRSEIGRLRDALRLYSAEIAGPDEIRIEIPKGSYRPEFSIIKLGPQHARPSGLWKIVTPGLLAALLVVVLGAVFIEKRYDPVFKNAHQNPKRDLPYDVIRIAVAPFQGKGANPNAEKLAFGAYSELSVGLSAYPWISVVAPISGFDNLDRQYADYVLIGDVFWADDTILTNAKLVQTGDQKLVWGSSQSLTASSEAIRTTVTEIASKIAFELGSIHGISPELAKARNAHTSPENLRAFVCFLNTYRYIAYPTEQSHAEQQECLVEAVTSFPTFGDGWAALGLIHMDSARFYPDPERDTAPWDDAAYAVEQALKYAPTRMTTLNVALVHSIEAPAQNLAEFRRIAGLLTQIFPHHPQTLNNVGSRMAEFDGSWEQGLQMIDQAVSLSPEPPSSFYVTNAYHAMLKGNTQTALEAVKPLTTTTSTSQLLLHYLAAARAGHREEMKEFRALLSQQGLPENADIRQHILARRYEANLETALLKHLEMAFKAEITQ
ncbi:MAG: hypothetical protein ABJG75_15945 [Roseobacter sp.]